MTDDIRVLHVDDDEDFLEVTAELLEMEDPRLEVAVETRAAAALDRLDEVDCVVSDYQMPDIDGLEFLRKVRNARPNLPFVLFTGRGSEEIASDAISAGVTDYLQKGGPETYTVLANRVTNAVDRARAEDELERSEERLRRIIDLFPHYVFIKDEDGSYLLSNEAHSRLHGTTVDDMEGTDGSHVLHEEERQQFLADDREVIESGEPKYIPEEEVTDADGDVHIFETQKIPFELAETDKRAVLAVATDITDLKERERELEAERDRRAALFENATDAIVEFAFQGPDDHVIRAVNPAFEEIFGFDAETVVGDRAVDLLVPEEERGTYETLAERARRGVVVEANVIRNTAEGTREFLLRTVPLDDDGTVTGAYAVYTDLSEERERARQIEALHESTRHLMRADSAEDVASMTVQAAKETLGYPMNGVRLREEDTGRLRPVAMSDESWEEMGERPVYEAGEGPPGMALARGEVIVYDDLTELEDGYERPGIRSGMYLPLGETGTLSVVDVEPDAFDDSDVQLASILAANAEAALNRVEREEELARRNERLNEFASVVSHDLRNPLNVAKGGLATLEGGDEETIDRIDGALDRMNEIIEDVLTLAKEGEAVDETSAVNLGMLAEGCWRNVQTDGATLEVDEDIEIQADPSRVRSLLENLFRNAIEHGMPEPPEVADERSLTVRVGRLSNESGFYVEDDGRGVPSDQRNRVFEAGFSGADASGSTGTGFGLTIVRQIARAHGWTVHLTDGETGGTRFEFTGVRSP